MTLKEQQTLLDLRDDANKKEKEWVKHSLSFISIILGLIISLKPKTEYCECNIIIPITFIISICVVGLCILSGIIFLYSEADVRHNLADEYAKNISEKNMSGRTFLTIIVPNKIFYVSKVVYMICLPLSIISILFYASLNEIIKYL